MKSVFPVQMEAAVRIIGVVANLQSSFSRPRRWCDAGSPEADQKAGVAKHQWWNTPIASPPIRDFALTSSIIAADEAS
jgi:hypothetical protein